MEKEGGAASPARHKTNIHCATGRKIL